MSAASESADWVARGRAHQWEGRPVDAMLCFRRASRADPRAPDPHFVLGEVLWQLGRLSEALAAWREAARLDASFLAPRQALAEALLAAGDAANALSVAEQVIALAPGNARAELIVATAQMTRAAAATPAAAAAVERALQQEPTLIAVATLSGPLALALDRAPASPERSAVIGSVARSTELLATAPLLLLAIVLEHPGEADAEHAATRASLLAAIRSRSVGPAELDALRRIAVAVARFDRDAALEVSAQLSTACAASLNPIVPVGWPRRTAGKRTRVVVLAVGECVDSATLEALTALASTAFAVTVATVDSSRLRLPPGVAQLVLADTDAAAGTSIAALDADVLVDLEGMNVATPTLLAQHPARHVWTIAALPYATPLVDRAFEHADALVAALRSLDDARDSSADCPLDAAAMAAVWTDALRTHQQGDREAAIAGYGRALQLQPGFAPAHYLLGVAQRDAGEVASARDAFAAALALAPAYVDARIAAVNAALAAGVLDDAVAWAEQGLIGAPAHPGLLRALGRVHLARRDGPAASEAFVRALQQDMGDGETHYHLGVALQMQRLFSEAARSYQRALAFRPDFVAAHFNLGVLFQEQGMTDAAIAAYGEVQAADPANVAAYRNVGEVLLAAGRIDSYLANFRRFEARCPDALPLAVQALVACQHQGDFAKLERYIDGLRHERFAARNEAELVDALEEILYLLLYFDVESPLLEHFARMYDAAARHTYGAPMARAPTRRPGRVRIGYLSGDLRNHVMGKMAWAAVEHHDKARFELFFYALSETDDEWTAKFRGLADRFHAFAHETEREAALRIAEDDLDILVDLSTHTKGARPGILALKPARVQITHVASAGTVGLSTIDFKLTDAYADVPASQALPGRDAAADGRLRLPVSSRRARDGAPVSPRRAGHCRRRRRDRRLREPDEIVAPLPHAVARRARAYPASAARFVAGRSRASRQPSSGSSPPAASGSIAAYSCRRDATTARTRPVTSSSTSCSTPCPMVGSTARWKRSTWECPS